MPAASTARRSGRVGAWSKELPGVAILKLSTVFALSFSFRDRRLVWLLYLMVVGRSSAAIFGSTGRPGQMSDLPHMRFLRRRWSRGKIALGKIAGQKYCSVPDPAHRRLAEDVRFPVTSGVEKDPT